MIILKNEYDSYLAQALATTSFVVELDKINFLDSKDFKEMNFDNPSYKDILMHSTLGNPATLQMFLYSLLVLPKELSKKGIINFDFKNLNNKIDSMVIYCNSDYSSDIKGVDYIYHIRNATAHGNFEFTSHKGKTTVVYKDKNRKNKAAEIMLYTADVGTILIELQKIILNYFKKQYNW